MEDILKDCEIALDLGLSLRRVVNFRYDRENILICGDVGSGKTTICKKLLERYREAPYFVYTHVIECRLLKGNMLTFCAINCDISRRIFYQRIKSLNAYHFSCGILSKFF